MKTLALQQQQREEESEQQQRWQQVQGEGPVPEGQWGVHL